MEMIPSHAISFQVDSKHLKVEYTSQLVCFGGFGRSASVGQITRGAALAGQSSPSYRSPNLVTFEKKAHSFSLSFFHRRQAGRLAGWLALISMFSRERPS